jgi:predicted PhzF superfamily epimerase YddE/YHI9
LIESGTLPEEEIQRIAQALDLQRGEILHHAWCNNGPRWRGLMLRSAEQVLALQVPRSDSLAGYEIGVVGPSQEPGIALEVRAFFPGSHGLIEDPVTGSLNAAMAQWLIGAGLAPARYVASQGTCLGRAGRVHVEQDGDTIWVGGSSVTCMEGQVLL